MPCQRACEHHKAAPLYDYVIRVNASGHNTLTGRGIHPPEAQPSFFRGAIPTMLGRKVRARKSVVACVCVGARVCSRAFMLMCMCE